MLISAGQILLWRETQMMEGIKHKFVDDSIGLATIRHGRNLASHDEISGVDGLQDFQRWSARLSRIEGRVLVLLPTGENDESRSAL